MRRIASVVLAGLVLCFGAAISPSPLAQSADPNLHYIIRVQVTDKESEIPRLAAMDLDLAGVDVKAETADFVGDEDTLRRLQNAGFVVTVVWSSAQESTETLSQYLDPTEVVQKLDFYQAAYPALAKKVQIATTSEGRPEWALKISDNVNADEDEPTIFYVAQHHAREVMTPEIAFDIIDYLLTRYASDTQVQSWVNGREIWVVPSHNPDGANTVFTSNSNWRKNRRNNGGGAFGVDPNRNYPFHWNFCTSGNGASSDPNNDTYRGPSAGSEPETQGYMQLARDQKPVMALSYHTFSELVIHPYGCTETQNAETRMYRDLSSDMAIRLQNDLGDGYYSNGKPWELLYEVSGDSDAWFYGELGTVATTIEANSPNQGFQPDYTTWRDSTVLRNRPGWQFLLNRVDGPSIWGHTTNACTGAPVSATIAVDEIVFTAGETPRTSEPGFGRYQWLTPVGLWHVNASKTGYRTQDWPVDVGYKAAQREIRLVPNGSFAAEFVSKSLQDPAGDNDGELDPGEAVTMPVTVVATGGALSGLTGVLTTMDPFVTVTDPNGAWPAVAAGGSAVSSNPFGFSIAPDTPDGHVIPFTLTFAASQSLCAETSTFEVRVTIGTVSCPAVNQPLDTNPGWTIQNSDALGWAFGAPSTVMDPVDSGHGGGPPSGHSGANVYGTNLTGHYNDAADYKLTTTAFNLTNLRNTELRFWRWLNNEVGYDVASVAVSTDGVNFTPVWSGFAYDTQWQLYRLDISNLADRRSTVYVQFRLQSDSSQNFSGFYIDDVSICGEAMPPEPRLSLISWVLNDGQDTACRDNDAFADAGETVLLTATIKNEGSAPAVGAVATLSSPDAHLVPIDFRIPLGTLAAGATTTAPFRFSVADAAGCGEQAPVRIDFDSNSGLYHATNTAIALKLQTDLGTPVPDKFENFENASMWALTGEWQIAAPQGKGGTANGGTGTPDPTSAFSGTKVLGVDLSGQGSQLGSYENNLSGGITATSPVYSCANSTSVTVSFKRWLGVEQSQFDTATFEVWDGAAWQRVYINPNANMSDSSWQSVSYDVTQWAAGHADFKVRWKMTSDSSQVYCGWNIDDLLVTNGYTPQNCESGSCAAGCTPAAGLSGVASTKAGTVSYLTWTPSGSACHDAAGGYHVYRSSDPRPRIPTPAQWPADSYFTDVTTNDVDGSSANASFTESARPQPGGVYYYLVVDIGTSGAEGPKGWQGF